jgi:hypothetical protein
MTGTEILNDIRFRQKIARLHRLGVRPTVEFLCEIGADRSITTYLEAALDRYVALDPAVLDSLGARDLPPAPFHVVRP